jgi:hypothetical protein
MASTIGWLDASPAEQRRVQEIVRMFSQSETTDELGGRQIFVVLSDVMFPGTSVLHGRARYLLFIPWLCQRAAGRANPLASLDRMERELILAFLADESVEDSNRLSGLIGREAKEKVKQLPSTAYWSGLLSWGILQRPGTIGETLAATAADRKRSTDADELDVRQLSTWHPGVGSAHEGFPDAGLDGGFELRRTEAEWLRERWQRTTEGSVLAHLAGARSPLSGTAAPWLEPLCVGASPEMSAVLEDAERFSLALEGAQLLYHLMLCESYLDRGFSGRPVSLEAAKAAIEDWADSVESSQRLFEGWSSHDFWSFIRQHNPRVNEFTRGFFDLWFEVLVNGRTRTIASDPALRAAVIGREVFLKKPAQSRLKNSKMLAAWQGTTPRALVYRWPQVQQLVNDLHDGLGVRSVRT